MAGPVSDKRRNVILHRIRTERGFASKLAKACGITREAVWLWDKVPAERAQAVSEITGVPLSDIRPDLWKRP